MVCTLLSHSHAREAGVRDDTSIYKYVCVVVGLWFCHRTRAHNGRVDVGEEERENRFLARWGDARVPCALLSAEAVSSSFCMKSTERKIDNVLDYV